ncbi:hypothetical protein PFISCL1PPCAC_17532 [Pristionchus fissidentatus]|uniref:THAP-type domain-containing protein n=1 Tax=Pristionchus fissidentatus TaxID=1538716 RepID=A0AAV5W769_9BILA|nr:hypothetical protein PFISCL1PPCAC_17532 [Pristionchus fissidentatus]
MSIFDIFFLNINCFSWNHYFNFIAPHSQITVFLLFLDCGMSLDDYWNSIGLALSSSSFYNKSIDGSVGEHLDGITESIGVFGERIRDDWDRIWTKVDQESIEKEQNEAIASIQSLSDALRALGDLMIYRQTAQLIFQDTFPVFNEIEIEDGADEDYGNDNYEEDMAQDIDHSQAEDEEEDRAMNAHGKIPLNGGHVVVSSRQRNSCVLCGKLSTTGRLIPAKGKNRASFLKSLVVYEEEEEIVEQLLTTTTRLFVCHEHIVGVEKSDSHPEGDDKTREDIRSGEVLEDSRLMTMHKRIPLNNGQAIVNKRQSNRCALCGELSRTGRFTPTNKENRESFLTSLLLSQEEECIVEELLPKNARVFVCHKHIGGIPQHNNPCPQVDAITPEDIQFHESLSVPKNFVPKFNRQVLATSNVNVPPVVNRKLNRKCDLCGQISIFRRSPMDSKLAIKFFRSLIGLTAEQRVKVDHFVDCGRRAIVCKRHVRERAVDMKQALQMKQRREEGRDQRSTCLKRQIDRISKNAFDDV